MQALLRAHHTLLFKNARRFVALHQEPVPVEDVAREFEVILLQLGDERGLRAKDVESPHALFRSLVRLACGRVKQRRTLIEQIAAGDDLQAVSEELRALDGDLPAIPTLTAAQRHATRDLEQLKRSSEPFDALVAALAYEDACASDEIATLLSRTVGDVEASRIRTLAHAVEVGIAVPIARRDSTPPPGLSAEGARMDAQLRELGDLAAPRSLTEGHVNDAIVRLLRDGDQSEDLNDVLRHVAACPDCRARLTEGEVDKRSVVVMAIEAPKASTRDLLKAAGEAHVRLLERGSGRWAAVMKADDADAFRGALEQRSTPMVTRIAESEPVDIPAKRTHDSMRPPMSSVSEFEPESGTSDAEVHAWAEVARAPRRAIATGRPPLWAALLVATLATAVTYTYYATHHASVSAPAAGH